MTEQEILDRLALWEATPAGRKPTADQLCVGRSDLLPTLRQRLADREPPRLPGEAGPPPVVAPGDRVLPNAFALPGYPLVRKLGEGGQAVVWEAVQTSTVRRVAVKVLLGGQLASTDSLKRLEREARVLADLRHPNIVPIVDRGSTPDGSAYLVMAFIPGRTLHEWLNDRWRPTAGLKQAGGGASVAGADPGADQGDPAEPLRLFLTICKAVHAAHTKGIVHRDLKPGNILVDDDGEPHVLDFGLARPIRQPGGGTGSGLPDITITGLGQFAGTLAYIAPEQLEGRADLVDARADVYALGVVLYQMLTGGRYPYSVAGTMAEVLDRIRRAAPVPPSKVLAAAASTNAGVPARRLPALNPGVEAIVLKALRKDPAQRYAIAGDLGRDVASYLAGLPGAGGPTTGVQTAARRPSAAGRLLRLGAVAAVAGAAGFGLAVGIWDRPPVADVVRAAAATGPTRDEFAAAKASADRELAAARAAGDKADLELIRSRAAHGELKAQLASTAASLAIAQKALTAGKTDHAAEVARLAGERDRLQSALGDRDRQLKEAESASKAAAQQLAGARSRRDQDDATIAGLRDQLKRASIAAAQPVVATKPVMPPPAPFAPAPTGPPREVANVVGMKLVRIEPGTFTMGSPAGEDGRFDNETPHPVTLTKAFYLGTTEVTQAQWNAVMGADNNPSLYKGDDLPVESVSWAEAVEYCKRLGAKEGTRYRLPTEAEWEYACRAGTTTRFGFGDKDADLHRYGNYLDKSTTGGFGGKDMDHDDGHDKTAPVRSYPPNAWGLYDMHGNVFEWCSDWYGEYGAGAARDPRGPDKGTKRVIRSGSWIKFPDRCRSACRNFDAPDYRSSTGGFRVVLDSE